MKFYKDDLLRNLTSLCIFLLLYLFSIFHFSNLDNEMVKRFILKTETLVYLLTFILFFAFVFTFRDCLTRNVKLTRKVWVYIAIIFLFAWIVRETIPPKTPRLFFDEDIYLDMARQIVTYGSSCLCDYGNKFGCFECELMKWPVGHPFLLSIPFFFLEPNFSVASHFMTFLSSLTIVFIFLTSYFLFKDEKVGIFSSLVLALLPVHILWSPTASADVTYSFFTSFILFFSILSAFVNDLKVHAISLLALSLSIQSKVEGIVLIPLYFLTQLLLNQNYTQFFKKRSYILMIIISFLLISVYLLHTFYSARVDTWGGPGKKFGLEYLALNLPDNVSYWFEIYAITDEWAYKGKQLYHPFILTFISIFGLLNMIRIDWKKALVLTSWFGTVFLLYGSFYAGSVYYGVDVRYVLPQYVPFSVLCGFGFYSLFKVFKKLNRENEVFVLLIVLTFLYFSLYVPKMKISPEEIEEASDARTYREFAINFASTKPDDCYFISHISSIYSWLEKGHMQIWYVYRPEFDDILKNNTCVIFDEGYWCNIHAPESQTCIEFNKKYRLELLSRLNDTNHGKVYSFYRIFLTQNSL